MASPAPVRSTRRSEGQGADQLGQRRQLFGCAAPEILAEPFVGAPRRDEPSPSPSSSVDEPGAETPDAAATDSTDGIGVSVGRDGAKPAGAVGSP